MDGLRQSGRPINEHVAEIDANGLLCPHCGITVKDPQPQLMQVEDYRGRYWALVKRRCPSCNDVILHLLWGERFVIPNHPISIADPVKKVLLYPRATNRGPVSKLVPEQYAEDYREACLVLNDSPKASAALTRRCLQNVLHNHYQITEKNLYQEIDRFIAEKHPPAYIADALDAVRHIGNFAAHPLKSTNTGEIQPVEPGEAEWNLDTVEALFDFAFVQPVQMGIRRAALNAKLQEIGKPPLK